MIIGLTGKSCSGKDYVSHMFGDEFLVIDEDHLGHIALDVNKDKLVDAFGEDILRDGKVDRKKINWGPLSSPIKRSWRNSTQFPILGW